MADKFIQLDEADIVNKSLLAKNGDASFETALIDRERIKKCLLYRDEVESKYRIWIDYEENAIELFFSDENEYNKMVGRLEG